MIVDGKLKEVAAKIRLVVCDCDGVLTDGRLYFTENAETMKVFDVKDGQGFALWHQAGNLSGIISGRGPERILRKRAEELGISYVFANIKEKEQALSKLLSVAGCWPNETAYIGDDIGDLGVMSLVALPIAVSDAVDQVRRAAHYVTNAPGGRGALREVFEMLLAARLVDE